MLTLKEVAKRIIVELKLEGFKIQLYESMSTDSIYIKLDYGVCNSIRVSDHRGKKHLQYRYNILSTCNKYERAKSPEGWDRYYYPLHELHKLVKDVKNDRKSKINRYGQQKYNMFMLVNKTSNVNNTMGFWSQCVEV